MALHHPIQNRIRNRRVPNPCMPVLYRKLARDDRRLVPSSVVNDLQQVRARHAVDRAHAPVIQDQHVRLRELQQPLAERDTRVPDA